MTDDRLSWVHDDSALAVRLDEVWPGWDDPNDSGLASQLDSIPGWDGWEAWSSEDKLSQLGQLLDAWYPPETGEPAEPADRVAWVREDPALVARLDSVWPGWAEPDGLAATLDHTEQWSGWDAWETPAKLDYLRATLDAWYPPASELAEAGEPATGLEAGVAEVLAQVLRTVPGAADLSEAELGRILAEALAKHGAPVPS